MKIGFRIQQRRKELGLTQPRLAAMCGWDNAQGRISNYEKDLREPTLNDIDVIAKALQTTSEWLMFGRESLKSNNPITAGAQPIIGLLPVLEWTEIPLWLSISENQPEREAFMNNKQRKKIPHNVVGLSERAFTLCIKNNSMSSSGHHPSLSEGEFVFIDPDQEVVNGKLAIVSLPGSDEAILRKYTQEGGKRYLIPLNPQYPSLEMTDDMQILGLAIGKYSEF